MSGDLNTTDPKLEASVVLDFRASQSLSLEGLRNEIARQIQVARKEANLDLQERVNVVFSSRDEYIMAAARLYTQYFLDECMLDTLTVINGENLIQMRGRVYEYNTKKWHTPVAIVDGDLVYKGNGEAYEHYWAALDAWSKQHEQTKSN